MFLTFAVRPLHPCFHGSLYVFLRAAIYRSLLLYCNRTLNAFRPRGSPAAASLSSPSPPPPSRNHCTGQCCCDLCSCNRRNRATGPARTSKQERRQFTARNTLAALIETQIPEVRSHFRFLIINVKETFSMNNFCMWSLWFPRWKYICFASIYLSIFLKLIYVSLKCVFPSKITVRFWVLITFGCP